jgi:ureidoacrylate peracid hydrolase
MGTQAMHSVKIRPHIIERLNARRGKSHWFESLERKRTALVVIDMQSTFCEEGAPAEVSTARRIVPHINSLTTQLRSKGVPIFWVLHANTHLGERSDWEMFFNHVVADDIRIQTMQSLMPGKQRVWPELVTSPEDVILLKNRYSAFTSGSSALEPMLRNYGIDTILIAGTKTNVCCESTGRDAMMLDFKVVMVSDCCAALSDEEHLATLETFIQQFGDVMTWQDVIDRLD